MPENLTNAERARLAHQALRLRENGVDSKTAVYRLADEARQRAAGGNGDQAVGGPGHPLAGVALAVAATMDPDDQSRPTAPKAVEQLMTRGDLTSIWQEWDDAVTGNLEDMLNAGDLKHWRDSRARDQKAFEERVAEMQETGDFEVHPYFGHLRHTDGAANALYDVGRKGFADGDIDLLVATVKAVLVDTADYTANLATDQFFSSIAVAAREEISAALTTKTTTAGVFDADDTSWPAAAGDPCEAVVYMQSSAVGGGADVADTAQRLIGFADTYTGLPVTLNGGTVNLVFDSGSNRIFKL